eukprot:6282105-Prymnesium_polylepis.1
MRLAYSSNVPSKARCSVPSPPPSSASQMLNEIDTRARGRPCGRTRCISHAGKRRTVPARGRTCSGREYPKT